MTLQTLLSQPDSVDEPQFASGASQLLSSVASGGKAIVVRRNGEDCAALVSMEQLEMVREIAERYEAELLAARINWSDLPTSSAPQTWFDETDHPTEPV